MEKECCENCKYADVDDWYCYKRYKPIEKLAEDVCEDWMEYE